MVRILVVEDDPLFGAAITHALQMEGYRCLLATAEQQMWPALEEFQPQVVIVDICLRGRCLSYDTLKRLRKRSPCFHILLMTGQLDIFIKARTLFPGFSVFLTKPFSREELLKKIHQCLSSEAGGPAAEQAPEALAPERGGAPDGFSENTPLTREKPSETCPTHPDGL
jgi:DNA-binding response OmpR family regulator